MRVISGIEELKSLIGEEIGTSEWVTVGQERINRFADATGDHQWIHVDEERAKRESPMGEPIAHGYLTLSLLPSLRASVYRVDGLKAGINYGANKVRFIAPVPAGSRIRARFKLLSVEASGDHRYRICNEATIEIEGISKPACVAETLGVSVFHPKTS